MALVGTTDSESFNCRHCYNETVPPFSLKYQLLLNNQIDRSKTLSKVGDWTYPEERKFSYDIELPIDELAEEEKVWIRQRNGVDCLVLLLRLMQCLDCWITWESKFLVENAHFSRFDRNDFSFIGSSFSNLPGSKLVTKKWNFEF